jgi:hypothetical protein
MPLLYNHTHTLAHSTPKPLETISLWVKFTHKYPETGIPDVPETQRSVRSMIDQTLRRKKRNMFDGPTEGIPSGRSIKPSEEEKKHV